jgi:hypothetical protein
MNRSIWIDVIGFLMFTVMLAIAGMAWAMALTK